ncbi:MAG: cell division protein ZapA [Proteobacteria bacterium]|nr:cell division protein ZapA [Pseudomonadota bacterium]
MAEIEISIGKSKYKIQCQESEKENLIKIASKLNERVNKLSFSFRNIDEKTLLVISALTMEEELQNSARQDESNSEITEKDIYDAVSENMENVSQHLNKMIKKIRQH